MKSLNARLTKLESEGLTDTQAYKNIQAFAVTMDKAGLGYINSKGRLRIKNTYIGVTAKQLERAEAIRANIYATYNTEMYQATQKLQSIKASERLNAEQQKLVKRYIARRRGGLHGFIVSHTEAYYGRVDTDNFDYAGAVHKSENLTLDEELRFFKLMDAGERVWEQNKAKFDKYIQQPRYSE